jgi:hypothetical protein
MPNSASNSHHPAVTFVSTVLLNAAPVRLRSVAPPVYRPNADAVAAPGAQSGREVVRPFSARMGVPPVYRPESAASVLSPGVRSMPGGVQRFKAPAGAPPLYRPQSAAAPNRNPSAWINTVQPFQATGAAPLLHARVGPAASTIKDKTIQRLKVALDMGDETDVNKKIQSVLVSGRHKLDKTHITKAHGKKFGGNTDRHIFPWELIVLEAIGEIQEKKLTIDEAAKLLSLSTKVPVTPTKQNIEKAIKNMLETSNKIAPMHFLGPAEENGDRNTMVAKFLSDIKWEREQRVPDAAKIAKLQKSLVFVFVDTPTYSKTRLAEAKYRDAHLQSIQRLHNIVKSQPKSDWGRAFADFDWSSVDPSRTPTHLQSFLLDKQAGTGEMLWYTPDMTLNQYGSMDGIEYDSTTGIFS